MEAQNNDIVKICRKHGELKLDEVYKRKEKYYECKICSKASDIIRRKRYREKNKHKLYLSNKEYCRENKDKLFMYHKDRREKYKELLALQRRKWRAANKEKDREYNRFSLRKRRENMSDSYMKALICGNYSSTKSADVPQELVECCRELLKLKRWLKENK